MSTYPTYPGYRPGQIGARAPSTHSPTPPDQAA